MCATYLTVGITSNVLLFPFFQRSSALTALAPFYRECKGKSFKLFSKTFFEIISLSSIIFSLQKNYAF